MNKYWASFNIALQHQLAHRGQLLGRVFVYLVVVFLFHQVFESVNAGPERLWYLAITEWLILSTPVLSFQIEQDIRSGQLAYFMLRPMHYLSLRFFEGLGGCCVRFLLLGICGFIQAYLLTRMIPGSFSTWFFGIFFGIIGILIYTLVSMLIGLSAFFIKEIHPAVFLNQTATFCFGGLIVPLSFYSNFWQGLSFCTPYPWILFWPAQFILGEKLISTPIGFLMSILWFLILAMLIKICYDRCLKTFVVEGG